MNCISDLNSFFQLVDTINSYKKVYIYGAGLYAFYLYRGIEKHCSEKIAAFVVSDKSKVDKRLGQHYYNKEIINVDDVNDLNDSLVIIAIQNCNAVIKILEEKKASDIMTLSKELMDQISRNIILNNSDLYLSLLGNEDYCIDGVLISKPIQLQTSLFTFLLEIDDLFMYNRISCSEFDTVTEGPYEIDEVRLGRYDIVFDIGAHIGVFSCIAATKSEKVYAFEPCSSLIPEIIKQSKLYSSRIIPVEKALSDYVGNAVYKIADSQGMLVVENNNDTKTEVVNVTTIDDFISSNDIQRVDFIKADIEGAERNMLLGATKTLKKFAPKLSVCTYHLPDDKEVLEKIVKDANPDYHIIHKYKKMYCWVD